MEMYDNDQYKLGQDVLRPKHRETNQRSWVRVITAGMDALNLRFRSFRESVDYIQQHDSRKIHIEKVLNDVFDPLDRRIFIENVKPVQGTYFNQPLSERDIYFNQRASDADVYFNEQSSVEVGTANFIVNLPIAIKPIAASELRKLEININTQVNRYKVDSKEHALLWIN